MAVTNYYTINGEIIGEKTTGGTQVDYLTDALGSVTATLNQSAQVVNTYRYKPYGALLAKTGVGSDPSFGWVGSQGYRQTGRKFSDFYVRARHDDSTTGRWTTKDPLGLATDNSNLYRYAKCRPSILIDSTGLIDEEDVILTSIGYKNMLIPVRSYYSRTGSVNLKIWYQPNATEDFLRERYEYNLKKYLGRVDGETVCCTDTARPERCGGLGTALSMVFDQTCGRDVSGYHELSHRKDIAYCCRRFKKCIELMKRRHEPFDSCVKAEKNWFTAMSDASEFKAYTVSIQLFRAKIARKHCDKPKPEDSSCCDDLKRKLDTAIDEANSKKSAVFPYCAFDIDGNIDGRWLR